MYTCIFCNDVTPTNRVVWAVKRDAICTRCATTIGASIHLDREGAERVIRNAVKRKGQP